ncbi:hypothetical protein TBLA_0F01340 [Henningerozyma blattae CBS 6284]|uniref:C2H2-type domain-containing protein n=1 Tax=Henningerozyma blattae (strain ATCC 34711 / CBS 6284 / DSM 70876 / NBRC 10599 / NRRL Y-10934 / UCD 77-7) TaxID=1071380 RepID=I2H5M5_HENB6|nr:hypothetical protein TBLA_0F01340 [Tetrapisispora blattae CBS 6284]CCH61677.1 hypothetical protein TBLA_0F01340 [Tetrapisispora blattae CBS 6284]
MSVFTCNSCMLEFQSGLDQRTHMKSDWHRYNLKRRVANLPPIDELTFSSKVQTASTQNSTSSDRNKTSKKSKREALLEKKKQLLELQRQRNSLASAAAGISATQLEDTAKTTNEKTEEIEPKVVEEEESQEQLAERLMKIKLANKVDIPLETCLFCQPSKPFESFDKCLDHMFRNHGFYIPEQKYLQDKEGLVHYLSEKIGLGNVCIVCNYQGRTLEATRQHMLAKRHCKIPYENEDEKLEISEFYDFSETYAKPVVISEADIKEADNDDWEDVDSDENSDDEEAPTEYLYHDGMELHLPNGYKIGHRSLQRYYKQNLRPERVLTEGQGTLVAAETRSFLTPIDKRSVVAQQRAWKSEVHDKKRDDKRAAKFVNNQPHYRDQLLQ